MVSQIKLLLFFQLLWICYINGQDIVACGGVVKSDVPSFDFNKLSIKLYLSDGSINYETEILPNGAFSVPIYDPGEYNLKVDGPKGWKFEPESGHRLVVDDKKICSNDYVFKFVGFSIYGKISTANIDMGPSGIEINMFSKDKLISNTKSIDGGDFKISKVMPGDYSITINLESINEVSEKNTVFDFKVTNDNLVINESFIIQGFPVYGSVMFDNDPLSNVDIYLFTKLKVQNSDYAKYKCNKFNSLEQEFIDTFPFCKCKTDSNGQFIFPILPGGKYVLIAKYSSSLSDFEIKPLYHQFEITSKPVNLKNIFMVTGFSIRGLVMDTNNNPIPNAKISIKNGHVTHSMINGSFIINGVKRGSNILAITADGYFFDKRTINFDPAKSNIGSFNPNKLNICGSIYFDVAQNSDKSLNDIFEKLKVKLIDEKSKNMIYMSDVKIKTDNNEINTKAKQIIGGFCFTVQPGKYSIIPFTQSQGLFSLAPARINVELKANPIHVTFSQFRGKIHGLISCLEKCKTGDFEVTLKSTDDTLSAVHFTQHISVDKNNPQQGSFSFQNIDPGQYKFELISANSLLPINSRYCWSKTIFTTSLVDRDLDLGVVFKQTGYSLPIISSHDIDISYYYKNNETNEFIDKLNVKSGMTDVCLLKSGRYEFKSETCHKLKINTIVIDTNIVCNSPTKSSDCAVKFEVDKFLVKINFQIADEKKTSLDKIKNVITGFIEFNDGIKLVADNLVWVDKSYQMQYWAVPDIEMKVSLNSSKYLIQPQFIEFIINKNTQDCETSVGTFILESGTFVSGLIEPIMNNVNISIIQKYGINPGVSNIIQTISDSEGKFSVGPLNATYQYDVILHQSDHKFVRTNINKNEKNHYHFIAYKLSELRINIVDNDTNKPLQGILLSIIGDNYRQNELTDKNGSYSFIGLLSGKYYIRAMMKELEFYPNGAIEVSLTEGISDVVNIRAKRTFFSIFGRVVSLSGDPETVITVEAERHSVVESSDNLPHNVKCKTNIHRNEYGLTDDSGSFRIRGLVPGCSYSLTIKEKNSREDYQMIRTFPNKININMTSSDIEDVKIIAIRDIHYQEVSAMVWTENKFMNSLQISVFPLDNPDNILSVHKFAFDSIFFQMSLPHVTKKTTFIVRLQSNLNPALFTNITAQEYQLTIDPTTMQSFHRHFDFSFNPIEKLSTDVEVSLTLSSMFLPFLIILLSLIFYKKEKLSPFCCTILSVLKNNVLYGFYQSSSALIYSGNSSSSNNSDGNGGAFLDSKEIFEINKAIAKPKPTVSQHIIKKIPFWQKQKK